MTLTHDEKTQQYIIDKITKIKRIKELNDHIFIVSLFDDDFESLFEAGEDPDFDSYSFQCATMKNIYDDLKNGIYRPVFEKDEATINRQKMRIRAYL
ncbi:MAG: hypothetical protein BWY74_03494 [Firmicutes bacterium ADurb.Bin419]|nr:MAG: hypothetical protein BWY74_03494 [Firmicutes bacterium ADurb.Bin419]